MLEQVKKLARHLPAVLGLALLVGAVYVVWKEFRHLKLADIAAALGAIPPRALTISFVWTLFSYGILTFYDRLGTIYAGHKVGYGKVAFASFCAYALSHNLGFAAVSGAAVRYRLYAHWGLTPVQIAKVVAFCSLTFGLGGMVLGGIILFTEPEAVPFFGDIVPRWGMYAVGVALWLVVAGYVSLSRFVGTIRLFGAEVTLPGWRMAILQVALATVDVAVTAAIVYQLLPPASGMTFVRFLGVYVASYTAGLAANIPGGLGVFDSAMLLGLERYMDAPKILGAVVVFRLYYYVIPLFLAGALFAGNEILLRGGALVRSPALARKTQSLSGFSEPGFAVVASTGAVMLCGALLLGLGVLDQRPDFSWIDPDFAEVAANAGQFIPSLMGAALIVLAFGLSQRVTLAWGATIVLLLAAAGFTFAQGTARWVPSVLVVATLLVAPFRDAYYRHARLLSGPLGPGTAVPLLALAACVLTLARFEPHLRGLSENSLLDVVLSREVPNSTRVSIALLVVLGLIALWRLIRPGKVSWLPWAADARLRYAALGAVPPATADGLVMGETGRAAIPFRRIGRVMLGLGDPAGAVSDRVSAIWNLRDLAQQEGLDPAVYRAGPALLKVYEDLGLAALPLSPTGELLPDEPENSRRAREYLCCVAERDLALLAPLLSDLGETRMQQAAE
ncbi:MAG: lysylphosphatidylglycerol synthetase family protein [Acetobacteraceae bacterium]|nr:lysylphosphatidylglycerol synthetase family protein [Acetobacteraceae bacterium]